MIYQRFSTRFSPRCGNPSNVERGTYMLDINIRQLETFVVTAEYSNFTRAAEELHLTQSTVSMHIRTLEEALHTTLILRGARRKFVLTEDGSRVYAIAKDILSRCQALETLGKELDGALMTIGTTTVPARYLLPRLLAEYTKKHDHDRYILRRGDCDGIHELLECGEVQLAFVGDALDTSRFDYRVVARDPLVLITENTPRFRRFKQLDTSGCELSGEPLIIREATSGTQHAADAYFRQRNIPLESLHVVAHMDSPETIKRSVAKGMGVSVISYYSAKAEIEAGELLYFELEPEGVFRNIYMAWKKGAALSAAEKRFAAYIRSKTTEIPQTGIPHN